MRVKQLSRIVDFNRKCQRTKSLEKTQNILRYCWKPGIQRITPETLKLNWFSVAPCSFRFPCEHFGVGIYVQSTGLNIRIRCLQAVPSSRRFSVRLASRTDHNDCQRYACRPGVYAKASELTKTNSRPCSTLLRALVARRESSRHVAKAFAHNRITTGSRGSISFWPDERRPCRSESRFAVECRIGGSFGADRR